MIATVAATTALPNQVVGKIDRPRREDEPVFLSTDTFGPEAPFATLEDAVQGAAFMSKTAKDGTGSYRQRAYEVYGIVREGDAFRATKLLTPIWERKWGVERISELDPVQISTASASTDGNGAQVEATGVKAGSWQRRYETITGTLRATDALEAVVGSGWAIVDGTFRSVEGSDPFPPPPPPPPPPPVGGVLLEAIAKIEDSIELIKTVPVTDKGDASTKDARIGAYNLNMAAQNVIEDVFLRDNVSSELLSTLRQADAHLEDANWQLAKKPSPDGRFNGVDIPGALRDSNAAVDLLTGVVSALPDGT